jgi:membrane protein implicated in regulation of membrane protease activity
MSSWLIWFIVAVVLFILEIFTPTFVLACFGIGCLVAGLAAYFSAGVIIQVLTFSLFTVVVFFGIRPFVLKFLFRRRLDVKTNVDALAGKSGFVIEKIDAVDNMGRVNVQGEDWRGVSIDGAVIEKGEKIIVKSVEGTKLFVEKVSW